MDASARGRVGIVVGRQHMTCTLPWASLYVWYCSFSIVIADKLKLLPASLLPLPGSINWLVAVQISANQTTQTRFGKTDQLQKNKVAGWYGALARTTMFFFVILSLGSWNVIFVGLLKNHDFSAHQFYVPGPWLQDQISVNFTKKDVKKHIDFSYFGDVNIAYSIDHVCK